MYEYTTFLLFWGKILQKFLKKSGLLLFFSCLTYAILCHPETALSYALAGLNAWFWKMIPTLFPFMVLSGMMLLLQLSDQFAGFFRPLLHPVFRVSSPCLYNIVIGFLCGFPMGSKITGELYRMGQITRQEAGFLLAFSNNIGPVFFTGFVLAYLPISVPLWVYLTGMYGIPLCYGLALRYLYYGRRISCANRIQQTQTPLSFAAALDASISSGIRSITKLGGCMIFFNLLNILPRLCFDHLPPAFCTLQAPVYLLMEITGGIVMTGTGHPLLILVMLQFGGCSCIAQTYAMIGDTDLSMFSYVIHKILQSILAFGYYSVMLRLY